MTSIRFSGAALLVSLCLALTATTAQATVLTFDDLDPTYQLVPDGYGGLDWSNLRTLDGPANGAGYANGVVSLNNVAYNDMGDPASAFAATTDALFDFTGAYLTAAWRNGLQIDVTGFRGGSQAYFRTVTVDTGSPTFFLFDFTRIDTLQFESHDGTIAGFCCDDSGAVIDGTQFAMDDFTYETPEPASLVLLGTGLLCILGAARRQKPAA
jgi:hypothetical protein